MTPVNNQLDYLFSNTLHHAMVGCGVHFSYGTENIPSTGKAIHDMWVECLSTKKPFRVFNGANEQRNLYFSPHTNELYRAVHDLDHAKAYGLGRGTTKYTDEKYLNCLMAKRAYDYARTVSTESVALMLFFAVYHDTVGQVEYYKEHNDFCVDQRSNTVHLINNCKGYKAAVGCSLGVARQIMLAYIQECGL